jgi:hypothetical protein
MTSIIQRIFHLAAIMLLLTQTLVMPVASLAAVSRACLELVPSVFAPVSGSVPGSVPVSVPGPVSGKSYSRIR